MIKTKEEYDVALDQLDDLLDFTHPGDPMSEKLESLAKDLHEYEREHFPIDPPNPMEAIRFRIDQQGGTKRLAEDDLIFLRNIFRDEPKLSTESRNKANRVLERLSRMLFEKKLDDLS